MPRIPFIDARFDLSEESRRDIESRLTQHFVALRKKSQAAEAAPELSDDDDEIAAAVRYRAHAQRCYPSDAEAARIRARSKKLALRRDAATGL
ncbi:hypothetical protein, partial [Acidimangrovimonas sediminis]|uniref:hypothetical protein n=1 Tax=Acidimangrovimonas sediminis TaxID=2056283 RepID=UPI0011AEFECD